MGHEKQQLLQQGEPPDKVEESAEDLPGEECEKTHGVLCRILTSLHLKKRNADHEKLLSESKEHLSVPEDQPIRSNKQKKEQLKAKKLDKTFTKESKSTSKATVKRMSRNSPNDNSNNNVFSTNYQILENDIHCSCESLKAPELERDHREVKIKIKESTDHQTIKNVHIYGDQQFGESYLARSDRNPVVDKAKNGPGRKGQNLKRQWHGKRAKKARKRLRRAMRATWHSLQSATNTASHIIPSPQDVSTAFMYLRK